ncbi:MAG: Ig-like domain repeat protein, partial [Methanobrevibacter sp.]|nr:Ig-like domain repeat protein [Methanobrevibacter sp.]
IGSQVIDLLEPGTYEVILTADLGPNYDPVVQVPACSFTVAKATPIVEVNDTSAEWNTPVSIPVKVTDADGKPISGTVIVTVDWEVDGVTQVVELDENGEGTANFVIDQALGDLTVTAKFIGNDNYTAAQDTAVLAITNSTDANIEAAADPVTFGEDSFIDVVVTDGRGAVLDVAKVNVTIDGETKELDVVDGKVNIGKLPVGDTPVTVSYVDESHKLATADVTVTVNPASGVQLEAVADNYTFGAGGKLNITVTDVDGNKLNGTVGIEVDGELLDPAAVVTDGFVSIDLAGHAVGEHTVYVTFYNESYLPADIITHFNVTKASPTVTITPTKDAYAYGEGVVLDVTVKDGETGLTGTVVVTINNVNYAVDVTDGTGQLTVRGLANGNYAVTGKFLGNDDYEAADAPATSVVVSASTDATMEVSANDPTYGEDAIITVALTDGEGNPITVEKVNVTVGDGEAKEYDVVDGKVTIPNLPAGDTPVTVSYTDDVYGTVAKDLTVSVDPASGVQVDAVATGYAVGSTGKLDITVADADGNKLDGTARIEIDGELVDAAAAVTGGVLSIDLSGHAVGQHDVYVVFSNDNYLPANAITHFIVTKATNATVTVTSTKESYAYGEDVILDVTVKDGETGLTGTVVVTVDGVGYAVDVTDGTGQLTVKGLANNTYPVTAKFLGNDNYEGADAEAVSVVVNGTTDAVITATVSEPSVDGEATLSVNVVDGAGNPVTGKVNVTVGDGEAQEYDVTDGVASIPLSGLALGENTIVVSTNEYTADPITLTAVVPPKNTADLTVGTDGENITIEAKDGTTPLNGTATVVIDGGEPITVPIDETGKAVIPMDDLAPGQHTVEVTFANDNYEPVSEVATITVPKGTVSVTITPTKDAYDFGEDVVLDLTVKDGETGVTGTVVVTVDGVNYAVDVTSGTGQLTVKGLASGTYEATADFIATDDYDAASAAPANVVVNAPIPKPIPVVTIVASKESYDFGEDVVLDVTVKDGETGVTGTVVVTVDGVEYLVDVSGGSGQLTVKGLINGDYEASADFIANDEYDAASAAKPAKFTVDAPIPVIQVDIVVTAEPDQVIIKLIDENGNPVEGKAVVAIDGVIQEVNVTGGIATIPASAGYHNISVVYEGDDTHAGTAVMKDIVVVLPQKIGTIMTISRSKTLTYNSTLDNRSDYLIYATLTDEYGNPLANKQVSLAAHGGIYNMTTNSKGQVRFYVAHSVKGVCTQALSFLGDEKYDASFVATNVQIEAQTVKFAVAKKTYKASAKTKKLTATLKNSKGKALAGKKVVFTVNGKKYTATTNSKGVATVKVSITKKGTYKVTATFAGDKTYKKATKTNKLVIK